MEINWLLISVLLIIAACMYHGWRCGLVRMLFSVATFIITVVLVRFLAPVGVQMIKNNDKIYHQIKAPIEQLLDEKVNGEVQTGEVLDSLQISGSVKNDILNVAESFGVTSIDLFSSEVKSITADCITLKVIELLSYVLLFLLINIGLRVVGIILDRFSKLPGIRGVNKLAGSLLGIIEGVVFVWICFLVITIFATTGWGSWCLERIGDSTLLSILYAGNVFLVFV